MESTVRQRAIDLIDELAARGSCDFMADFATRFPTTIFLEMMGLPVSELDEYAQMLESGSQLGLESLPLVWDV
ncbi:hypothetical protein [Mycolicibacterium hodleri]|uniref:hypothetical protein n=1 Tax=Mycolicibacterium hodleri TaxID=49897 RepID=UPI001878D310|nr:hypothetical protein [Mycolicibacterium hodleri]